MVGIVEVVLRTEGAFLHTREKSPVVHYDVYFSFSYDCESTDTELNRARHQILLNMYRGTSVGYSGLTSERVRGLWASLLSASDMLKATVFSCCSVCYFLAQVC